MENVPFDVELSRLTKRYGNVTAVDNFSLQVPRGSFTTLLGPSGCGKTTLLRIIAGFFEPDSGDVFIMGKNQKGIAPEERGMGIVFQDYALFPHMTNKENLAYGLKIRRIKKSVINEELEKTARLLGLEGLLNRYPGELSGGQQQRLALGRAVILNPRVLLMDEPLSSLDAKLRLKVREELKEIQRRLGITTVYVTHDQEEALSLSDYIAVMHEGRLEQFGSPRDVYNTPANAFAADFSGPANFFTIDGKTFFTRPEWVHIVESVPGAAQGLVLAGKVIASDFLGRLVRVRIQLDLSGEIITAEIPPADCGPGLPPAKQGQPKDAGTEPGTKLTVVVSRYREIERGGTA
ncbi:MAG: ABC transporter ATP-binding protein [Spirochaetaceae bacterium]|jgi:ABC-type Fe3+/spermidine/putrescine transport system ATPase subunit|nr:ABC transporter ATP-binding protein [Spirochaetaceae bacterium]